MSKRWGVETGRQKFDEMGKDRAAFNEMIAKDAIKTQGYYRFEAKTWDPVAQTPGTLPG
jgi:hypothetical protein